MKYIIEKTAEMIRRNSPSGNGETMIRVDGFEDVRFYDIFKILITISITVQMISFFS